MRVVQSNIGALVSVLLLRLSRRVSAALAADEVDVRRTHACALWRATGSYR